MQSLTRILLAPQSGDESLGRLRAPQYYTRRYHGVMRIGAQADVWFEETPARQSQEIPERHSLPMRLDLRNHSPTGFAWGYGGSGPAQLALALLVDAVGDTELALAHYQDFKREHVSRWGDEWSISAEEIRQFVARRPQSPQRVQFPPGSIVATPAALRSVSQEEIFSALKRHLSGDWGELDRDDWDANNEALLDGARLFSAYCSATGQRFWIITEANRQATTVLLPEDY